MTDHRARGRIEALAYQIWSVAQPNGWNMTIGDVADALGESIHRVRAIAQHKGWQGRLRTKHVSHSVSHSFHSGLMYSGFDGPARLQKGDGVGGV